MNGMFGIHLEQLGNRAQRNPTHFLMLWQLEFGSTSLSGKVMGGDGEYCPKCQCYWSSDDFDGWNYKADPLVASVVILQIYEVLDGERARKRWGGAYDGATTPNCLQGSL